MTRPVIGTELGPEFIVDGSEIADKITIRVDGTSVQKVGDALTAVPPVWDNTAKTITFPAQGTAPAQVIDLSQFVADVYVNGGSFDPNLMVLTLSDNDGTTPDVTVDLSALLGVSTDADNILVNGADGKPSLTQAMVAAQADTTLSSWFGTDLLRGFAP